MPLTTTKTATGVMQYFLTYVLPLIGLALTIFGLWLTICQIRSPNLVVTCKPPDDGNPASLDCEIRNTGRGEAKHVSFSFKHSFPLETKVLAPPEVGARIVESEHIPDAVVRQNEIGGLSMAKSHLTGIEGNMAGKRICLWRQRWPASDEYGSSRRWVKPPLG